jgi:hypothetical protein
LLVSPTVVSFSVEPPEAVEAGAEDLASGGLPGAVLFSVAPSVVDWLFCCAIAPSMGNASKPATNITARGMVFIVAVLSVRRRAFKYGDVLQTR